MSLKISRILHAGYVFESEFTQILFDPIFENPFSRNCYAFPNVKFDIDQIKKMQPDAIFISHYHDDHCSLESLNYLNRSTPIYIFCVHEEIFEIIRELGFNNVQSLQLNQMVMVGNIGVTPRRALDRDVDSIFHIRADGLNVLNVVDAWIDNETLQLLKKTTTWDMILWPFQTMREIEVLSPARYLDTSTQLPFEWLDQLRQLRPKVIVPSSCQFRHEDWSWYNHAFFPISYQQFESEIKMLGPSIRVLRLNPGVSIRLTSSTFYPSSPLPWIQPIGNQDVDYRFTSTESIPTTGAIAVKLLPTGPAEMERAFKYCRYDILQVFQDLCIDQESYFQKPRLWRLELYDSSGRQILFHYRIKANQIALLDTNEEKVQWRTEVPIAKLFAALEYGESLTSMYLRINNFDQDFQFDPIVEQEIGDADWMEDPLVRCLFDGVFGAYQKHQLKRIKGS